jgi:hypothetical protein
MSRFIDKLTRLNKVEPQPMGFLVNKSAAEKKRMQLVALVAAENAGELTAGLTSIDAALIEVTRSEDIEDLEKACQANNDVPGGGWLRTFDDKVLKKAVDAACDFWVYPADVPLSVTQKEETGRILEIDLSLSEGLLRTVSDLPVDAVLAAGKEDGISLTLGRFMYIQRLAYLVNKPILVRVPAITTPAELQALWDMGVSGVLIEVADEKSGEKLVELREAIDKLNPAAFRKRARMSAVLPRLQPEQPVPVKEEEEEEEQVYPLDIL